VSQDRPPVPRPGSINPQIETLKAGSTLVRVYERPHGPLRFNPTASVARFRPVTNATGAIVPTAYCAVDSETAIAEAVLRGVSALSHGAPRRRLYRLEVSDLQMAWLKTTHAVRVVRLHGLGLSRLDLLRGHVIDCEEVDYDYTAAWAQALYGHRTRPHGLAWTSRQNDSSRAFVLWGGSRVRPGWLRLHGDPLALDRDPGLDLIRQVCADAGVDFEG
jgi:hypothetical protein